MSKAIDWQDLQRLSADPMCEEEFLDNIEFLTGYNFFEKNDLEYLWNTWKIYITMQNSLGAETWDVQGTFEWAIALRIIFDELVTDELIQRIGTEIFWGHEDIRDKFFYRFCNLNPSSKKIKQLLQCIGQEWPDAITNDDLNQLSNCKYFRIGMLEEFGIKIHDDFA